MKIILATDTHLSPRAPTLAANWQKARSWIEAQQADAVIHLGDITADAIARPEELQSARDQFSGLEGRLWFLPGNHDIGDHPPGPGVKAEHPLNVERLSQYHDVFGAGCWWFQAGEWQCIGLNAQLLGTASAAEEAQYAWLARTVGEAAGPLALFLHKPLFRDGWSDTEIHNRYIPAAARQRLKASLPQDRLKLVASGHAHQARRLECDGANHVWIPSTSFCIPDALQERLGEKIVGLGVLELYPGDFALKFVQPPGMIRHNLVDYDSLYPQLRELEPHLRSAGL